MKESNFEKVPEENEKNDLYEGIGQLSDYYNEYANLRIRINFAKGNAGISENIPFTIKDVKKAIKETPIKTFEERYLQYGPDNSYVIEMSKQRAKVDRMNLIAERINKVKDL